jgi:hypothetical protein
MWRFGDENDDHRAVITQFQFEHVELPEIVLPYGFELRVSTGEFNTMLFLSKSIYVLINL